MLPNIKTTPERSNGAWFWPPATHEVKNRFAGHHQHPRGRVSDAANRLRPRGETYRTAARRGIEQKKKRIIEEYSYNVFDVCVCAGCVRVRRRAIKKVNKKGNNKQ